MVLYITKKMALEGGMTHEGTLYGMPVWLADVDDPEIFRAAPKLYVFRHYLTLRGFLMQIALEFTSFVFCTDVKYETPLVVRGKIE